MFLHSHTMLFIPIHFLPHFLFLFCFSELVNLWISYMGSVYTCLCVYVCICATTTTLNCCDMLRVGGPDDIFYLFNRFVFAAFTCDQRFIYDGVLLGLQQPIPNPHVMFTMWSVFIYFGNSRKYHAFAWIVSFAFEHYGCTHSPILHTKLVQTNI